MPYSGSDTGDVCPDSCSSITVSYSGGYIFTISGAFTSDLPIFIFYTIKNIPVPKTAITTSSFEIKVLDSTKAVLHS